MCTAVPKAAKNTARPNEPDRSAISSGWASYTALLTICVTRTPESRTAQPNRGTRRSHGDLTPLAGGVSYRASGL